ncbi:uncharacterized protein C8Q71DRAFT_477623 [Rhodofomes roseus]|uniref:Uncharacterized protein n=1 Tax=Rhodofomes roseus TaxID=34475 RepID=A0ABQ8KNZ3_9APHY|nr:uncharacterized protein C8Q71DRAFT_477623 [Rhodofomes roseus]KAH9840104.1 hypothetical protein C8Q71DRAFT_477623 [Rhodofomes roseus]
MVEQLYRYLESGRILAFEASPSRNRRQACRLRIRLGWLENGVDRERELAWIARAWNTTIRLRALSCQRRRAGVARGWLAGPCADANDAASFRDSDALAVRTCHSGRPIMRWRVAPCAPRILLPPRDRVVFILPCLCPIGLRAVDDGPRCARAPAAPSREGNVFADSSRRGATSTYSSLGERVHHRASQTRLAAKFLACGGDDDRHARCEGLEPAAEVPMCNPRIPYRLSDSSSRWQGARSQGQKRSTSGVLAGYAR